MATAVEARAGAGRGLPGRRYDRIFFGGMTGLILAIVAVGFAPTYYAAGMVRAHLPSPIIHVHAAVFSSWILLLAVQTGLVSARRVAWHRTLGVAGFCLAVLVVTMGFLAMADQLRFKAALPGMLTFSAVSMEGIFLFGTMAAMGYATRKRDLAAHKRYILLATLGLIDAALFRMHMPFLHRQFGHDLLVIDSMIAAMAAYDWWSLGRVHRATLWGGVFLVVVEHTTIPLGGTAAWHAIARWIQGWGI